MTERLLLLDGHSLAYRAFYGMPAENFITSTGQVTNAVYGFTSMLLLTLEQRQPTHVAVAFDVSRETFRRQQYPDYKANRAATPAEFAGQIELIKEVLDVLGVRHECLAGYEADDIIATWASKAAAEQVEVTILTGDRDALQLVNERITVLYPRKGVTDLMIMTPDAVREKYGVSPEQYADVAAMRGDSSDNLPGIPGVGEKTAANWLNTYGSLSDLIANADKLKGKVGESFRAHVAQAQLNRQLTELVRDVPGLAGWHDLHQHPGNENRLHELFDALQFKALRPRALRLIASELDSTPATSQVQIEASDVHAFLRSVDAADPIAVAWQVQGTEVTALAVAVSSERAVLLRSDALAALNERGNLIGHHLKPLLRARPGCSGWLADTALMAYLARPGVRSTDLAECAQRFLGLAIAPPVVETASLFDSDHAHDVAAAAAATFALYAHLRDQLARDSALSLLLDIEMPLLHLLVAMEGRGISVDREVLLELDGEFAERIAVEERAAFAVAGETFNLGSPKQLQELLFGKMGLPKTKRTKTGYTTDAEALQSLFERTSDPLLAHILQWREVSKLRQTVTGLLPSIAADGRVHTNFQQTVAATGRLASTEPNLQNIPVRTSDGRRIRRAFIPGPGFDVLMTADYSQIEMRIMAHLSQDVGLIEAFLSGEDLHTTMASQVFGVDEVTPDHRRRIKAMSYGLAYGLSAYGLAAQLGVDAGEAQRLMAQYFDRFGRVQQYLREAVITARSTGYTETMMGRRRYLPDLNSDQRVRREIAERMALNAPIQGSAADVIKAAMLAVEKALRTAGLRSRLLLQVHDELVLECPADEVDRVSELVAHEMGHAVKLSVPLDVSIGVGSSWDAAAH